MAAQQGTTKQPIAWGSGQTGDDTESTTNSKLEEERLKHAQRASKFGVEFKEPGKRKDLVWEARRERTGREGFITGMDLFDEEQTAKRKARADRFGATEAAEQLEYRPVVDEDIEQKRRRAARFGVEYVAPDPAGLMDVDLLEGRRDVAQEVRRRPEAIHLYGVDLLSTAEVLSYFDDYGPTFVEWINDSSCNVVFGDEFSAKRAIVATGNPVPPEDTPDGQGGLQACDVSNVALLWHKGRDFQKGGVAVPLVFRLATEDDVKDFTARERSRRLWTSSARGREGAATSGKRRRRQQPAGDRMDVDGEDARRPREKRARRGGTQGDTWAREPVDAEEAQLPARAAPSALERLDDREDMSRGKPSPTLLASAAATEGGRSAVVYGDL